MSYDVYTATCQSREKLNIKQYDVDGFFVLFVFSCRLSIRE